jgi:putative PIN family toxin of toxin-antitoxin system
MAFEGPAAACVDLIDAGVVELYFSKSTLAELRRVLTYPRVLAISWNMTPMRTSAFVQRLTYRALLVRRVLHRFNYPRDPKDEPYINLAIAANADYLVSDDLDLLSLMTAHDLASKRFRRLSHPLHVVKPSEFLKIARR